MHNIQLNINQIIKKNVNLSKFNILMLNDKSTSSSLITTSILRSTSMTTSNDKILIQLK